MAEYVIALHDESRTLADFKAKLNENGAPFPESVIENMDRLILSMHPKHKKKSASTNGKKAKDAKDANGSASLSEQDRKSRIFPGLALPDQEWQPSPGSKGEEKDAVMKEVDDLMSQLEGVSKKSRPKASEFMGRDDSKKSPRSRNRDGRDWERRSHSPPPPPRRRSASPPRRGGDNGYGDRRGRYDDGPRGRAPGRGRQALDERPVLYKIYDGRVTGLKEFGAFVSLEGIMGRAEGRSYC